LTNYLVVGVGNHTDGPDVHSVRAVSVHRLPFLGLAFAPAQIHCSIARKFHRGEPLNRRGAGIFPSLTSRRIDRGEQPKNSASSSALTRGSEDRTGDVAGVEAFGFFTITFSRGR
jgi:hypothetical protein